MSKSGTAHRHTDTHTHTYTHTHTLSFFPWIPAGLSLPHHTVDLIRMCHNVSLTCITLANVFFTTGSFSVLDLVQKQKMSYIRPINEPTDNQCM